VMRASVGSIDRVPLHLHLKEISIKVNRQCIYFHKDNAINFGKFRTGIIMVLI
jgi:hypothetical protein